MFNIGSGEMMMIAVVALLLLGPSRLPELARGIGKFIKEFRRQTDDVRGMVEREFYKMDSTITGADAPIAVRPATDAVALQGVEPVDAQPESTSAAQPAPSPQTSQDAVSEAGVADGAAPEGEAPLATVSSEKT